MSITTHQLSYDQISELIAEGIPERIWPKALRKQWIHTSFIDRLEYFEEFDTKHQDNPNIILHLGECYLKNGNFNQAEKTYARLKKIQPKNARNYLNLAICALTRRNIKGFELSLRKFLVSKARKKIPTLLLMKLIVSVPDAALAYKKIIEIIEKSNIQLSSKEKFLLYKKLPHLVELNPPENTYKRALISHDSVQEIACSPISNSGKTVIMIMINSTHFGMIPIQTIDRYLASKDITLITCFDSQHYSGLKGFKQYSKNIEGSIEYLKDLCGQAKTQHLTVLSNSIGSYGAVHYGLALRANNIITFSGIGDISYKSLQNRDIKHPATVRHMNNIFSEDQLDLSQTIHQHTYKSPIHWIYGHECYIDSFNYQIVADIDNVKLIPMKLAKQHDTVFQSCLDGTLLKYLIL